MSNTDEILENVVSVVIFVIGISLLMYVNKSIERNKEASTGIGRIEEIVNVYSNNDYP